MIYQLILWVLFCMVFGFLTRRNLLFGVCLTIALYVLVPYVASSLVTGVNRYLVAGVPDWHPASWLVLSMALVRGISSRPTRIGSLRISPVPVFLLVFAVLVALGFSIGSTTGWQLVVNQIIIPIAFFFLLRSLWIDNSRAAEKVALLVVGLACVQSLLALAVWLQWIEQPYLIEFERNEWWGSMGNRGLGTMDHPLVLALFLVVATPLLSCVKSPSYRVLCSAIILSGVLITQSRAGILLCVVGFVYLIVHRNSSGRTRGAALTICVAVCAMYFLRLLPAGLSARLEDDNGSADARGFALEYALKHWRENWIVGNGGGTAKTIALQNGLSTSPESAFIMYGMDFGYVSAVLYFVAICLVVISFRPHRLPGSVVSVVLALVMVQTFSSIATETVSSQLLWWCVGLSAVSTRRVQADRQSLESLEIQRSRS